VDREARRERIAALRQWRRELETEWAGSDYPDEVARYFVENMAELRDLEAEELAEGYAAGRYGVEHGSDRGPRREDRADLPGHVRTAHDAGLRVVERHQGQTAPRQADRLDALIRERDPFGFESRYLVAVANPAYRTAFHKILADSVTGHLRFNAEEVEAFRAVGQVEAERALGSHSTPGSFALPITIDPTILPTGTGSINPIRQLADSELISTDQWKGVASDQVTASYVAEVTEATDNTPTMAQPALQAQRGQAFIPVSIELTQDWANIAEQMSILLRDGRDQLGAVKMLTGTGTNEPGGILNIGGTGGLTTTQRVLTAATNAYAVADVYSLKQALPPRFLPRAQWTMSPTIGDTTYRFVPAGSTTEPPIMPEGRNGPLVGKPLYEWSSMITFTTTGSQVAIVGQWDGYKIVDRIGAQVELIPHLFGATSRFPLGQRGFYLYWRTGAGVVAPNRFRYLQVK
jgi:HK97 family phage major capsid protein